MDPQSVGGGVFGQRRDGPRKEAIEARLGLAGVELRVPDQVRQGIAHRKGRGHLDAAMLRHGKERGVHSSAGCS